MTFQLYTSGGSYTAEASSVQSMKEKLKYTWVECDYMGSTYYVRSKRVRTFRVLSD